MIKTHSVGAMSGDDSSGWYTNLVHPDSSWDWIGDTTGRASAEKVTVYGLSASSSAKKDTYIYNVEIDHSHNHTYGNASDNPETRPVNYTVKIWKRTA